MSKQKAFSDQLLWFYQHCSDNHELLQTSKKMIDVAIWTLRYVRSSHDDVLSTKDLSNFADVLSSNNKCSAHKKTIVDNYVKPISAVFSILKHDVSGFTDKELWRLDRFEEDVALGRRRRTNKLKI